MSQRKELISVIVITYCSGKTVIRTLESIKAQNYERMELVIADDASKDDTTKITDAWIAENENYFENVVKVYATENKGIPGNLNRGIKKATGTFVKLMAADDVLYQGALQEYADCMLHHEKVLPLARVRLLVEGEGDVTAVKQYCDRCYEVCREDTKTQFQKLLKANWVVSPAADFYRRDTLLEVGGFVEEFRWMEDYPMSLKLMNAGYRFQFIDEELVGYRISAGSVTGGHVNELKKTELKVFFKMRFWYMIRNGMALEAIKQSKSWILVWWKCIRHQL